MRTSKKRVLSRDLKFPVYPLKKKNQNITIPYCTLIFKSFIFILVDVGITCRNKVELDGTIFALFPHVRRHQEVFY